MNLIRLIKDTLKCGIIEAKKTEEYLIMRVKGEERNQLLNEIFIRNPDVVWRNYERYNIAVEMFLDKKYNKE